MNDPFAKSTTTNNPSLWETYHISIKKDGIVSRISYRLISLPIVYFCRIIHLSPNHVTYIAFLCGIIASYFFLMQDIILALTFLHLRILLDGADGQLAIYTSKRSAFGGFIDPFLDRLSDILIFATLSLGYFYNTNSIQPIIFLVIWLSTAYIIAHLNSLSIEDSSGIDRIRKSSQKLFGNLHKYIRWDGGFTGLIFTIFIIFGQIQFVLLPFLLFNMTLLLFSLKNHSYFLKSS